MADPAPIPNGHAPAPAPAPTAQQPPRAVLLLIDVQVNMLAPGSGVPNAGPVRATIERALHAARSAPRPPLVVHVRNCGAPGEPDARGARGWQLACAAARGEPVLDKTRNNAFAGTPLPALVPPGAATALVVAGMQSDFCIRATCSAALARGNSVFLVAGAHATYDRPEAYAVAGVPLVTPARAVEQAVENELEEAGVCIVAVEDLPHVFAAGEGS
ncbi:Isochorismatase hydrolase [Phellopilus nigrolimitatus]|nr:Isochorismatase hydrolase [Phellopilus nigrolimitatus]